VDWLWATYIAERRPHWGALQYRDHIDKAKAGGLPSGRRGAGKKLTQPGPLAALMPLALRDLEQPAYDALLPAKNPATTKKAREAWGKAGSKKDALQKGQLAAWRDSGHAVHAAPFGRPA
jgi:hypothetical protein